MIRWMVLGDKGREGEKDARSNARKGRGKYTEDTDVRN